MKTLATVLCVLALAACARSAADPPAPSLPSPAPSATPMPTAPPDAQVTLAIGEEAIVDDLTLRFDLLVEDSRCARDVQCAWSGQAVVALTVTPEGGDPVALELTTLQAFGDRTNSASVAGHTVTLLAVDPYPGDEVPPGTALSATLAIA